MKKSALLGIVTLVLLAVGVFFYFRTMTDLKNIEFAKENTKVDSGIKVQKSLREQGKLEDSRDVRAINGGGNESVSTSQVANVTQGDTINLRDFGVMGNGRNETAGFQKALDAAVGKVLYIPKQQGSYYLTRQLLVPSNSTLVFDSNVIVQATDDLRQAHANFEALFRIENADNVNIKADNALFRMNKSAYKGEHNHIFMINGSSNVSIHNAKANDSGGDGFYIGAYKTAQKFSKDIRIIDCVADNNRRQGISIISAKDVIVQNCVFSNTKGASPESGLDIEPNRFDDVLENIVVEECMSIGNAGRGFMVAISSFDYRSKPVSVSFDNCVAKSNYVGFASVYFLDGGTGNIFFNNCIAENSRYSGFLEASCSANGIRKTYTNCKAINNNNSRGRSDKNSFSSNFYIFESERQPRTTIGNSVFKNCVSEDNRKSASIERGISVKETGKATAKNITISGFSSLGHNEEPINLMLKSKVNSANNIVVE